MPAPRSYFPPDGGLIYAETPFHLQDGQWLIEPWNAVSSLLIILPGLFFLYRLRGQWRQNWLLVLCAPFLMLGGLGSTLYHGLRNDEWLIVLDVLPTLLVFVVMIAYLWYRVFRSWLPAVGVLTLILVLTVLVDKFLNGNASMNAAYFIRGTAFFIPLLILLFRTRFYHALYMVSGLVFFLAALAFRFWDVEFTFLFPMGSHFLWHVATGIGGVLIAEYLISLGKAVQLPEPPVPEA